MNKDGSHSSVKNDPRLGVADVATGRVNGEQPALAALAHPALVDRDLVLDGRGQPVELPGCRHRRRRGATLSGPRLVIVGAAGTVITVGGGRNISPRIVAALGGR